MNAAGITGWYAGLAPRDQRILKAGAIAVGVILLLWILLPMQRNLSAARAQLQQQQADLEWMRQVGPTLAAAGPGPVAAAEDLSPGRLLVLIDTSVREAGLELALTGSQPAPGGGMRVQFENAEFDKLLLWLSRITSQNGLQVQGASVTGGGTPGVVNASIQVLAPSAAP